MNKLFKAVIEVDSFYAENETEARDMVVSEIDYRTTLVCREVQITEVEMSASK